MRDSIFHMFFMYNISVLNYKDSVKLYHLYYFSIGSHRLPVHRRDVEINFYGPSIL